MVSRITKRLQNVPGDDEEKNWMKSSGSTTSIVAKVG